MSRVRRDHHLSLTKSTILKRPRINHQIRAPKVRLIDEAGQNLGIMDVSAALGEAQKRNLDLVEIAPTAQPPVVKVVEFGKYLYQLEKQERKQKTKRKSGGLKSVKIGLSTSEHDAGIKIKKLQEFLAEGYKVKVEMFLRGRERANKQFAEERFKRFLSTIDTVHTVEQEIKRLPSGFMLLISK